MLTTTTTRVLDPATRRRARGARPRPRRERLRRRPRPGRRPRPAGGSAARCGAGTSDGRLESLCYAGANLVPICASPEAVRGFADRARRPGAAAPRSSAPSKPPPAVVPARTAAGARPARSAPASRSWSPTAIPADVPPDPLVRRIRKDEMDPVMPACVAMFTEEVGVSPLAGDGGLLYQARVAELVGSGPLVRPHRGRPGRLQGRDRRRHPARLPDPGRLGRPRIARRGPRPRPAWRRCCATR